MSIPDEDYGKKDWASIQLHSQSDSLLRFAARAMLAEAMLAGNMDCAKWVLLNLKDE